MLGIRALANRRSPGADLGGTGTDYNGALGDAFVRNLLACGAPSLSLNDDPAVLPANLQSSASASDIVQAGYIKCGAVSGSTCGDIPPDGSIHFVYICIDNSGGQPCLADGWAGTPILGRRYRFRVQYNQLGTGQWDYSIKDLTTGVTKSKSIASHWHNADGAWWGGETHDTGSTMGPEQVANNSLQLYWMEYLRTSIGSWQVVTSIVQGTDLLRVGAEPSWYHNPSYNQNYTNDAVNIYTEAH